MNKFAVGDKVRRVKYAGVLEIGEVYTVSNVSIKGFVGVEEFTSEDGDKTPFDVANFELVASSETSDKSESSETSESDIVKVWFDKLVWLYDNSPITIGCNLNVYMEDGDYLTNQESVDFVINSYAAYQNKAKQKEKQSLLDKKKALELELAQINEQLGE